MSDRAAEIATLGDAEIATLGDPEIATLGDPDLLHDARISVKRFHEIL